MQLEEGEDTRAKRIVKHLPGVIVQMLWSSNCHNLICASVRGDLDLAQNVVQTSSSGQVSTGTTLSDIFAGLHKKRRLHGPSEDNVIKSFIDELLPYFLSQNPNLDTCTARVQELSEVHGFIGSGCIMSGMENEDVSMEDACEDSDLLDDHEVENQLLPSEFGPIDQAFNYVDMDGPRQQLLVDHQPETRADTGDRDLIRFSPYVLSTLCRYIVLINHTS